MTSITTAGKMTIEAAEDPFAEHLPEGEEGTAFPMKDEEYWSEETGEARLDVWGIASSIDIYGCDPGSIRDAEYIKRFTEELCDLIEMKRFGETQVVHFGEDERVAGFSMVQLIETSLISAHFANQTNTVYLDVFSCKAYDPETVREFARRFFGGKHTIMNVNYRR